MPRGQIRAMIAVSAASLLLTVGGSVGYMYAHLNGNIHTAGDLNSLTNRPPAVSPVTGTTGPSGATTSSSSPAGGAPINVLLLGSQTRDGQSGQFGNSDSTGSFGGSTGTDISDTSMLLHISGDRKYALVVSIPRDTLVDRPTCPTRDGKGTIAAEHRAMFDASMSLGGPLCAAATVEQYFHVRVDHFVRLDFNGFRKIVSYLGGVEVCIPPGGINDPFSHLDLPAGRHVVTGDEALAFVRDRHGIGDGSDLGRIEMQKMFLTSLVTKIEDAGTLRDATRLYQLADVTTSSITTDDALGSVPALLDLAGQVQGLKPHDIHFVTMPTVQDSVDPNRVDPAPSAETLWALIRADQRLDGTANTAPTPGPTDSAGSTLSPTPSTSFVGLPNETTVAVSNGTTGDGVATRSVTSLKNRGVNAFVAADTPGTHPATVILYTAGHATDAQALVAVFPHATTTPVGQLTGADVEVVLGDDTAGATTGQPTTLTPTTVPPSAVPTDLKDRPADADICSNLPQPNPYAAGGS